ncbi:ABC transporter ATP-binding protein [Mariluticola halotolerans]|uniref:ABC transporter ATP-binding protein n=1 Tax=Mariluticola halotolerans TaxID=2909283 RepID=UPI0026E19C17|nr:ABC transporter ATP-binding protein [Mariluticola halotolerans]UJQ94273.1 ABC transporter ATP-binding protein [Mariluticola halotolerans]
MSEALLDLKGVGLAFAGNTVLDDVHFQVPENAVVSLIGPNGAGKTSLFNCITGFYKPQKGSVMFDGREMLKLKPHGVTASGIARTFQNLRMFREMTVLENVMSGLHCRTSAGAIAAILKTPFQRREEAEIDAFARECLDFCGVDDDVDRIATTLAYGHQRRVEIARALATKPKLLLLDEPAAGLNAGEKQELVGLINRIRDERGISVLLIEHDTGLVMKVSERIHVLDHGVMIAEGTAKEIQSNPKVIEAYLGQEDGEASLEL